MQITGLLKHALVWGWGDVEIEEELIESMKAVQTSNHSMLQTKCLLFPHHSKKKKRKKESLFSEDTVLGSSGVIGLV